MDESRNAMRSRESFNAVADDYNRFRRPYPAFVVDVVVEACRIGPGSHVLEIGCGTGQLTGALLKRHISVWAVELGAALAAHARRNLAAYDGFQVTVGDFESVDLPQGPIDAVLSATAFHWVDPTTRAAKAARALKPGGMLSALYPHHVLGNDAAFFRDTQVLYLKWGLSRDPDWTPPAADAILPAYQDIDACPDLEAVTRRRIPYTSVYSTEEYVGLLRTDSLILTLPEPERLAFLSDMAQLIDSRHQGRVNRRVVYEIVSAKKRM